MKGLTKELLRFWDGIAMDVCKRDSVEKALVRFALLCCACDLPAGRKVCGFLGCSAALGCSKCLKRFTGTVGSMNYGGFDCSIWPRRTFQNHEKNVQLLTKCKTKTELSKKEAKRGCRYSALIELSYFNPCRMLVIDPMHNLFLGSAKHLLHLWPRICLLSSENFQSVQKTVDSFVLPSSIGRLPHDIIHGFSGFTADQFKNWITIFSIPSLFSILSSEHLELIGP